MATSKPLKLSDERGLYLQVNTTGSKIWKYRYGWLGKEQKLTIGRYPGIGLAEARIRRDQARALIEAGTDPRDAKKARERRRRLAELESFEKVARQWHATRAPALKPRYASQILDRLVADVFPEIGRLPIRSIEAPDILDLLRKIEQRGAHTMAQRVRIHISDVFAFAIASGLAASDPALMVRKAMAPRPRKLRHAIIRLEPLRKVLPAIEQLKVRSPSTLLAHRMLALTAVRPGVLRRAERSEFFDLDGEEPSWRIPAEKMKLTAEQRIDAAFDFFVPLSRQAAEIARLAIETSQGSLLFPGGVSPKRLMSDATLSKHYRAAGFQGLHCPHGWRASFSTIMNERAAERDRPEDREIIDLMLAHVKGDVEAAYNRAAYMPRRRFLAQEWADLLAEGLPSPKTLFEGPRN